MEVVIADDELKPDVAVTKIRALIERDRVDIFGIVFSNVMMAVYKPVRDAKPNIRQRQCRPLSDRRRAMLGKFLLGLLAERRRS